MQEGWRLANKVLDIGASIAAKVTQFDEVLAKKMGGERSCCDVGWVLA
jgi:hypothetical protein